LSILGNGFPRALERALKALGFFTRLGQAIARNRRRAPAALMLPAFDPYREHSMSEGFRETDGREAVDLLLDRLRSEGAAADRVRMAPTEDRRNCRARAAADGPGQETEGSAGSERRRERKARHDRFAAVSDRFAPFGGRRDTAKTSVGQDVLPSAPANPRLKTAKTVQVPRSKRSFAIGIEGVGNWRN
jgi:hypothetical protein